MDLAPAVSGMFSQATQMNRLKWRAVVRSSDQLRLHPALHELGLSGLFCSDQSNPHISEPVLITTNGVVMTGFRQLLGALVGKPADVDCFEQSISDDEALQFILRHHCTQSNWNAFNRIRIALKLEPALKLKAIANFRARGNDNGLANLPKAEYLDVRREIGRAAGVGGRNVSKVKEILNRAHPRLIDALRDGRLSIHRAAQLCVLPRAEQLNRFTDQASEQAISKLIRQSIVHIEGTPKEFDTKTILNTLLQRERQQPGSVEVRPSRFPRTIVLLDRGLFDWLPSQPETKRA